MSDNPLEVLARSNATQGDLKKIADWLGVKVGLVITPDDTNRIMCAIDRYKKQEAKMKAELEQKLCMIAEFEKRAAP